MTDPQKAIRVSSDDAGYGKTSMQTSGEVGSVENLGEVSVEDTKANITKRLVTKDQLAATLGKTYNVPLPVLKKIVGSMFNEISSKVCDGYRVKISGRDQLLSIPSKSCA